MMNDWLIGSLSLVGFVTFGVVLWRQTTVLASVASDRMRSDARERRELLDFCSQSLERQAYHLTYRHGAKTVESELNLDSLHAQERVNRTHAEAGIDQELAKKPVHGGNTSPAGEVIGVDDQY